jgi:hypothetical protein
MKIVIIILVIVLAVVIILRRMAKYGRELQMTDPLYSITKDSFLGFRIGDSIQLAWSRINQMNLMSDKEVEDFKHELEMYQIVGFGSNTIRMAKDKFKEINSINLGFNSKHQLDSIMVFINNDPSKTVKDYIVEIGERYKKQLGESIISGSMYRWEYRNNQILLFNNSGEITLHIQQKY